MTLTEFVEETPSLAVLSRSIERSRIGHAYMLVGSGLGRLERIAVAFGRRLLCERPFEMGVDACDQCDPCRRTRVGGHPDMFFLRPESKLREIRLEPTRELMRFIQVKPYMSTRKVAIVLGADRMNTQSANAFLKTLEEPPANVTFVLASEEASGNLETIISRCLQVRVLDRSREPLDSADGEALVAFARLAREGGLLGKYRAIDILMGRLSAIREEIAATQESARDELGELEGKARETRETELNAALESEYRKRRESLIGRALEWMRDVWARALGAPQSLALAPDLESSVASMAKEMSREAIEFNIDALEELLRTLKTNAQEALAIEVAVLELKL